MRILPDGTVEIKNKKTGESKIVKPDELPNYGISYSTYADEAKAFASVGGKASGLEVPLSATDQKKADAVKAKSDIVDTAKQLQTIIANKDKYDPKDYQNILSSMSSALVLKKKEAENLGASLTGNELSILSGQVPQIEQRGQNLFQKALGIIPKQTTKVLDDEKTINNKLNLLIAGLEGKTVDPEMLSGEKKTSFGEGLAKNAGQDVKDILNGILGLPKAGIDYAKDKYASGVVPSPTEIVKDVALGAGKGILNEANELVGRPLEGGDVVGRIGDRAYNKPVTTALDLLPFLGMLKKAGAVKSGVIPETAASTVAETAPKASLLDTALGKDLAGRSATKVGVIDPSNVARSEKLMGDALKITKNLTRRGMAKELETFVPKAGQAIDELIKPLDKTIGLQPIDDINTTLRERLAQTTVGQANPELVDVAVNKISKSLLAGDIPGGMKNGQPFGTNISKINETRKLLNKSIPDSWFESKPAASNTDNLSHLNWEASQVLKEIISEADESGKIGDLISKQHVALEAKPTLSKMALSKSGVSQGMFNNIRKAFESATEPAQIAIARKLQGNPEILDSILNPGGLKSASPAVSPLDNPYIQKLLPQDIIENMLSKKGEAQSLRLKRDMRYGQGNPTFKDQSKMLEQSKKKRYN